MSATLQPPAAPADWHIVSLQLTAAERESRAGEAAALLGRAPVCLEPADRPEQAWLEFYFAEPLEAELAATVLRGRFPDCPCATRLCAARDWAARGRERFRRRTVGRLLIVPAWDADPLPADALVLRLEPGLSFGTGEHFTTRFCLERLEALIRPAAPPPAALLDVGCGSGILALAAARLGVPRVVAFDHDPLCVAQARAEARRNGLEPMLTIEPGDVLAPLPPGPFPIVCANLYSGLLEAVAPRLTAVGNGVLILSGLLESQAETVARAFQAQGAREVLRDGDGEWVGLVLRCPDHAS